MAEEKQDRTQLSDQVGYFDIYIRFNDDMEKDYCFQIKTTTVFKDLYQIFKTLPIALRPSVFYESEPIGFKVCTSPGYLTEDGNFLFDYNATKFQRSIPSINSLVSDHVWPGQLILPIWKFNYFNFYSLISFLVTWLYTDLPDFISPTPGICLTNQATKGLSWLALYFNQAKLSNMLIEDINSPVSVMGQIIFFVVHIFKVLIIFALLYTGTFNPIKIFRISNRNIKLEITKEELVELGWTGTRKATPDEYKDYYREYKIKEHGGMIAAHKAGLFENLKNLGCLLEEGEGYNTPIDTKVTLDDLLKDVEKNSEVDEDGDEVLSDFKLSISYEYFAQLGSVFTKFIDDKEGTELNDYIKQYRRYGLLFSNDTVKNIVKRRKAIQLVKKLEADKKKD
ncbi:glucose signaling factor 2 [Scheffersomyces coipomensis]|uniref:glucose signaling factor 2 n=1 Tax=Scheffersomyces coipomensis TaxID=1788519 RepID=UPI00315DC66F